MRVAYRLESSAIMRNIQIDQLRFVIFEIANALKFNNHAVWRRCDASWRRRVCTMHSLELRRELRFLLRNCGFRRIARFHQQLLIRRKPAVLLIVGQFIVQAGMARLSILRHLINDFEELCGK